MKTTAHRCDRTITVACGYRYLLRMPPGAKAGGGKRWPLVLFLHGMGERGQDLDKVRVHGPLSRRAPAAARLPAIVVAPQCPEGEVWNPFKLLALLDHLEATLPVDPARVYATGLSMGGAGTWSLAFAAPGRLAAIAPVCGPMVFDDPVRLRGLPVWCFHGAMDDAVPLDDSLRLARWTRSGGADVRLGIYPDANHDSWTETYANPELWRWLLSKRLKRRR